MKSQVVIFDTTLRDGEQWAGGALKISEKLQIAQQLAFMRVDVIEAGFPASSDLDFRSVKRIAEEVTGPRIAGLARAHDCDIERAAAALENCSRPRIHTFIATSEKHMRDKLGKTPDQVLRAVDRSVRLAASCMQGRGDVEWSAEDASRSSANFLAEAVRVAIDAGATTINLPDTLGYTTPCRYADMFRKVIAAVDPAPSIVFSAHVHNDRGLAVANSMAAVAAGARQVECTIRGVGERAGNAQLEAVAFNLMLADSDPLTCNIDMRQLTAAARLHASFVSNVSGMMPVVGDNAFAHGSGIHQDGMIKGGCYEYVDPRDYGHEQKEFPLTRHSGAAGINSVLRERGVHLSPQGLSDFTESFKRAASEALEDRCLRIVPPELAVEWAQRYAAASSLASAL